MQKKSFIEIADNTTALIWLTDLHNRVIWCNKRWLEFTGNTLEQGLGRDWVEGIHPDDYSRCKARCNEAFNARRAFEVEFRLKRADGSYGWVGGIGTPSFNADGEFEGYLGYCWDTSERRQTLQALHESTEHTQAILDNAVDGIITIDAHGRIQSFNRAATRIFGYAEAETIGRNVSMLMPEPHRSRHDSYMENYHATGVPRIIGIGREVEGQRKDGSTFPMDLAVSQITRGGQPMYVGLVRDITERKHMEQMKTEFVSTVSHELRTPLTSITGALGLIAGGALGELPPQAREMVDIAHKNSLRLAHLINDLLDVEKLAAGKMRLELKAQPLMPLIEQALEANRSYGEQHRVRFKLSQRDDHIQVRVDGIRLQQVLTNFLSNAAKFSPPDGEVAISVRRSQDRARVEISDHGPGIPEEFHSRIFQKFSQAYSSSTRSKGGSGLGLAISKELVEHMDGSVGFVSREGEGATFHFELPLCAGHTATPAPQTPSGKGKARLLVVEDDPDIARLLVLMLQRAGYAVDVAANGVTAFASLAQNRYDAITLDLLLPDHNGIDIIRHLRSRPETAMLPVIVVSAHAQDGQLAIDGDFSAIDWLEKPVDEALLIATVRRSLQNLPGGRPRILHVEDDGDLHNIIAAVGNSLADFDTARSLAVARSKLALSHYSLVVLDIGLPDGSGLELLPLLKTLDPVPPVIVLSSAEPTGKTKAEVQATLVKTRNSNLDFLETLKRLLPIGHAA